MPSTFDVIVHCKLHSVKEKAVCFTVVFLAASKKFLFVAAMAVLNRGALLFGQMSIIGAVIC